MRLSERRRPAVPYAAKRPCPRPGCPVLIDRSQRYCPEHQKAERHRYDERRPNFRQRYGKNWEKIRQQVLMAEPTCRLCWEREKRTTASCEVDHIIPLSKGGTHERENLRGVCEPCHQERHRGEFGWKRKS